MHGLKKKDKYSLLIVVGVIAVVLFIFGGKSDGSVPQTVDTVKGSWDISQAVIDQGLQRYLVETVDFDYSNQKVYKLAQAIKSDTNTAYDAVKMTADYVYENVQYSSKISIAYCYDETAASVLEDGRGDCVSMSRLVTALLRAQGIPARTVGGCLSTSRRCSPMYALYPTQDAQVTEMIDGDFKKRGFLHEYLIFWTPETSWLTIEATSGQIFTSDCDQYLFYSFDSNQFDRCVVQDASFWNECQKY